MRPDSQEWIAAKSAGDRAELAVAEWFRGRGLDPYQSLGRADFDLLLQCSVEVKNDRTAAKTGNIAVETSYRGQPSGIVTSPAQFWAIVVGDQALIVKTVRLRDFVLSGAFREVAAGDGLNARVRLVPLEALRSLPEVQVVPLAAEAAA